MAPPFAQHRRIVSSVGPQQLIVGTLTQDGWRENTLEPHTHHTPSYSRRTPKWNIANALDLWINWIGKAQKRRNELERNQQPSIDGNNNGGNKKHAHQSKYTWFSEFQHQRRECECSFCVLWHDRPPISGLASHSCLFNLCFTILHSSSPLRSICTCIYFDAGVFRVVAKCGQYLMWTRTHARLEQCGKYLRRKTRFRDRYDYYCRISFCGVVQRYLLQRRADAYKRVALSETSFACAIGRSTRQLAKHPKACEMVASTREKYRS